MRLCRVETERRLVALLGELQGWTTDEGEGLASNGATWWVSVAPVEIPLGRTIAIGVEPDEMDGDLEQIAIAGTVDPSEDQWSISCYAFAVGENAYSPIPGDSDSRQVRAKAAVESAVSDVRELLAANPRLSIDGAEFIGVHDVRVSAMRGPYFAAPDGGDPGAYASFTISARAQLRAGTTH